MLAGCAVPFRMQMVAADPRGGSDAAISPDGNRVVFSSRRSGNFEIWIRDLASGRETQVTHDPADDLEAQWSPDGARLAFTSTRSGNKDLFVLTLASGELKQLTDDPDDDEYPNWSPDGRTIVYTGGPWRKRDFFLVGADGSHRRRLTQQSGWAGACSFVPDGKSVVCHRYDLGSGDVVRVPLDGGPVVTLTSDPDWDYKPTVSPTGEWLAFSRSHEGSSGIWMQPWQGGTPAPLTSGPYEDRWPTWSAKGGRMLFHRVVEVGSGIHQVDRQSGALETLVGPAEHPLAPALSPDGNQLVYCVERAQAKELRVLDLRSRETRAVRLPVPACFPRWSPRDGRIAFFAYDGDRWQVATADADGQHYRVWTREQPGLRDMYGLLDWSPDGRLVVFHAGTEPFASDLFLLDTGDGSVRNLTHDEAYDESPSFAPDGKSVVFMSTRGGNWTWGLYRLSLTDGAVEKLSAADYEEKNFARLGADGALVWSRDDGAGSSVLAERRTANGQVRTLAPASTGARWPSFSPDGRHVVFATVERRTEYWLVEGVRGRGSPLAAAHARPAPSPLRRAAAPTAKSPVKLDHS
jgi:TolB protein